MFGFFEASSGAHQPTTSSAGTSSANFVHKTRHNLLAISREEKLAKQDLTAQRVQRIRQNAEALLREEQQRERQRQILLQKAAIYERMSHGERLVYEGKWLAASLADGMISLRLIDPPQT
jgi:hypothetical protein